MTRTLKLPAWVASAVGVFHVEPLADGKLTVRPIARRALGVVERDQLAEAVATVLNEALRRAG